MQEETVIEKSIPLFYQLSNQ